MIVFYVYDDLLVHMRLCAEEVGMKVIPMTLFGLGGYNPLQNLLPVGKYFPSEEILQNDTESDFDYYFWKQLMESEPSMLDLGKIVECEFNHGADTLIAIKTMNTPYRASITQSIILYMLANYGLEIPLIQTIEDIYSMQIFSKPLTWSHEGAKTASQHIEWFIQAGGEPLCPTH